MQTFLFDFGVLIVDSERYWDGILRIRLTDLLVQSMEIDVGIL